jgi:predicted nucleotidyltransferase
MLNVKRLYAFGSAVSGDFNENSDIDFLISFSDNLSPEEYSDNYFNLHYKLRELFNRSIESIVSCLKSNDLLLLESD